MRYSFVFALLLFFTSFLPASAQEQLIANGGFENGITSWTNTRPDKCSEFTIISPGYAGNYAARWTCLYSNDARWLTSNPFTLTKGQWYRIRIIAYSTGFAGYNGSAGGEELALSVVPCNNYAQSSGIKRQKLNLTTKWKVFTVRFKATKNNCSQLAIAASGHYQTYNIDNVGLALDTVSAAGVNEGEVITIEEIEEQSPTLYLPVVSK